MKISSIFLIAAVIVSLSSCRPASDSGKSSTSPLDVAAANTVKAEVASINNSIPEDSAYLLTRDDIAILDEQSLLTKEEREELNQFVKN